MREDIEQMILKNLGKKIPPHPRQPTDKKDESFFVPLFFGAILVLNLAMAFRVRDLGVNFDIDFLIHNELALQIARYGFDFSNLYHNLTAFIFRLLDVEIHLAAGLTVFSMRIFFTMAVYFCARHYLKEFGDKWIYFCVLLTTFGGSIPNLLHPNFMYYRGFGVNVWHNPTTFTVMPFVIISFFLFCHAVKLVNENVGGKNFNLTCLFLTIALALSVYGKASWLPPFAMAALIFLFVLWAQARFSIKRMIACVKIGLTFIPAGLWLIYVSTSTIYQTTIVFGISQFLRPFPILLNLIFPLFVLFLCRKSILARPLHQIAWITYICALLQGVFLVEPTREYHGNLTWAILYSLIVLLMVSLIEFANYLKENPHRKPWVFYVGMTLASIYCASGLYYALHIYVTGDWWF